VIGGVFALGTSRPELKTDAAQRKDRNGTTKQILNRRVVGRILDPISTFGLTNRGRTRKGEERYGP